MTNLYVHIYDTHDDGDELYSVFSVYLSLNNVQFDNYLHFTCLLSSRNFLYATSSLAVELSVFHKVLLYNALRIKEVVKELLVKC